MSYRFDLWRERYPDAARELMEFIIPEVTPVPIRFKALRGIKGESDVQQAVRLEAGHRGARLFRNNVGAGYMQEGRFVRWGLANDSDRINENIKSSDLIGWRTITITPQDVGRRVAQFLSREIKFPNWKWSGSPEEIAQAKWCALVLDAGGDAAIVKSTGSI